MSESNYRRIGALLGLGVGFALTFALGFAGQLVPGALLGAGGCVAGAMIAERLHAGRHQ